MACKHVPVLHFHPNFRLLRHDQAESDAMEAKVLTLHGCGERCLWSAWCVHAASRC